MKKVIGKIFDKYILEMNCIYDYNKFKKYFSSEKKEYKSESDLKAWILQDKHRIEKGLSLPNPRKFFGEVVLKRLAKNLLLYRDGYCKNDIYFIGLGAIKSYTVYHESIFKETPKFIDEINAMFDYEDFSNEICDEVGINNDIVYSDISEEEYYRFVYSRHSCRNFELNKDISKDVLLEVTKLSIKSPSVCNRQHWKLHIITGDKMKQVLNLQNGNTGFSDNIPYLAVITSDIGAFYSENERNQPYVDGGLFAMNFMYALHSKGISSCALNWCNNFRKDQRFYKLGFIPNSEVVVMLVAFGYPKKDFLFAKSPRFNEENYLIIHE